VLSIRLTASQLVLHLACFVCTSLLHQNLTGVEESVFNVSVALLLADARLDSLTLRTVLT
jgi:hypothetical protein